MSTNFTGAGEEGVHPTPTLPLEGGVSQVPSPCKREGEGGWIVNDSILFSAYNLGSLEAKRWEIPLRSVSVWLCGRGA
jgi:hypothetical protein